MNLKEHVCICKEGCLVDTTQSSFSVYGDKTNYQFQNGGHQRVSKYIVDDCVLAALKDDEKCDYLFIVKNSEMEDGYFIELKGSNVPKAINQLTNSIRHLKANISGVMFGRIICSKFPQAPVTFASNAYIRLRKILNDNLTIKVGQLSESI